ncbi:RecX family transcriptional regulator [Methylobacterium durans]|uniref:Regulatory protein RecX n=2 Tax=Methylobacterium durans TaxID=2202825 RepID=A0A2U8WGK2_9HYPH|nr:RecX family transcriptional regulator [Methylobacterium durans]
MLRRTLRRRVEKRTRARGEAAETFAPMVEETVARAARAGLVDDARFTAARLATLRRRGASARGAAAKLAAKGVPRDTIAAAMEAEREAASEGEPEGVEEEAARAYAKRRRLGPFRRPDARAAHRDRDLAALARAGFPYDLARRIVDAEEEPGRTPPENGRGRWISAKAAPPRDGSRAIFVPRIPRGARHDRTSR